MKKRRLSLVAILVAVFVLTMGPLASHAACSRVDLSGDWYLWVLHSSSQYHILSLDTDINGNPTYVLEQDGEKLICTGKGKFGELTARGTIKGKDFEITGTAGTVAVRFVGTFEEGRIDGKVRLGFDEADFMMKRK